MKKQLNNRVRPEIAQAVESVRNQVQFSKDELAEVAWATLFGSRDPLIEAKAAKVHQAVRHLKIKLSFNFPTHRLASAV